MGKLHERPVIEEIEEASDPTRFDSDLAKILIAHDNNPEEFFRTVVGFVDRKTRFFKQPDASRKLAKLMEGVSPATSSGKGGVKGGKSSEQLVSAATKVLYDAQMLVFLSGCLICRQCSVASELFIRGAFHTCSSSELLLCLV